MHLLTLLSGIGFLNNLKRSSMKDLFILIWALTMAILLTETLTKKK